MAKANRERFISYLEEILEGKYIYELLLDCPEVVESLQNGDTWELVPPHTKHKLECPSDYVHDWKGTTGYLEDILGEEYDRGHKDGYDGGLSDAAEEYDWEIQKLKDEINELKDEIDRLSKIDK